MTTHISTGDIIYYLSEAADDETLAWLSDNSGPLRSAVRHAELARDVAELRQRVEAAEREAGAAKADAKRASDEWLALSQEATRLAGALAVARQTNVALQAQLRSTPEASRSASAAAFSESDIRDIHAALSPPADVGVRTKGMQAINAFADRMAAKRNPATVPSVAELTDEAVKLQSRLRDAEYGADTSRRVAAEFRREMSGTQARVDQTLAGIAATERNNEELRQAIKSRGADTPEGMSRENIKALRLALHPDRQPKPEELAAAREMFNAYLSRTGRNTNWDAERDRRQREQEARERAARAEAERKREEAERVERVHREARERSERERAERERERDARGKAGRAEDAQPYSDRLAERLRLGNFKVGDILYCSWGYSMTLVDFYEVVYAKGKSIVTLLPISARTVSGSAGYQGEVVPIPGAAAGAEIVKRPQVKGGSIYVKISDSQRCYLWDGKPKYFNRMD